MAQQQENSELDAIDGEIVEHGQTAFSSVKERPAMAPRDGREIVGSGLYALYFLAPILFLLVSLLGGLRITAIEGEMLFIRPALICLVFAMVLLVLFFRAHLLSIEGWFSEKYSPLKNAANAGVLVTLFFASTQIFNSLIPEQGLAFWVISFCFFWTLWNYLFADFETKRLMKSLIGLFSLAFIVKYLILNNFVSNEEGNWLTRIWNDPTKEAVSYLLNIPQYAAATGYIQFFMLVFYMLGLYILPPAIRENS